jgi:cytochrome c553
MTLPRAFLAFATASIVFAAVGFGLGSSAPAQDNPPAKLLPTAKATDCTACHGDNNPLPADHPRVAGKTLTDCVACHTVGGPSDLRGQLPLFHAHLLSGLTCKSCHADPANAQEPDVGTCTKCHDMDKVSAATAAVKPRNPHNSPHYGKDADCNLCHHQHQKSENYCATCHQFKFKVP